MIFQIAVGPTGIINQPVPFIGLATVKVIKIDYQYDTAALITQATISINSQTLINTPLSGKILFLNSTNPYYGDTFVLPNLYLPGLIDIQLRTVPDGPLPGGAGGYHNCIITLDVTQE